MEASKYQKAIYEYIQKGTGNLVIEACAGAGKTSTIVESLKLIPENKKILFIAFNKSIVSELQNRVGDKSNVTITTMHALGFKMLRSKIGSRARIKINEFKYNSYVQNNMRDVFKRLHTPVSKQHKFVNNVIDMLNYGRNYLASSSKEMKEVADKFNLAISDEELSIVMKVMEWGKKNIGEIDFTDMVWLPNALNISPKYDTYDFIMLDEAQDANLAQIGTFLKCKKLGTRVIAVGDENQSIYGFCGASKDSFSKLKNLPNTQTLPLSISYRCPKQVVALAKEYSDNIEASDTAAEGVINYETPISEIQDGGMVVCRNNAPLIKLYFDLIKSGKKAYLKGEQGLFEGVIKSVTKIENNMLSTDFANDGILPRMYEELLDARDKMCNCLKISKRDASTSSAILQMYDKIQTVEILSEGLKTRNELLDRINSINKSSDKDGICLSSIHKAKGLEADNVYILCPSLMPSKNAKKDWEKTEENNLIYVAYTRAKKTLSFLSEVGYDEFSTDNAKFTFADTLADKEVVINKLLNRISYVSNSTNKDESFINDVIRSSGSTSSVHCEVTPNKKAASSKRRTTRRIISL